MFRSPLASSRLHTGSPRPPPKPTRTKRSRSSSPSSPDGKVKTLRSKPKHIFLPVERVASEKKRSASLVKRSPAAVPASAKSTFTARNTPGEFDTSRFCFCFVLIRLFSPPFHFFFIGCHLPPCLGRRQGGLELGGWVDQVMRRAEAQEKNTRLSSSSSSTKQPFFPSCC